MQKSQHTYLFLVALIILEVTIFLSNDMYLPAMPRIGRELNLSVTETQLTLTLWFLGASSFQLILGPISDRFGRRLFIIGGGVVYVISSYLCAVAANLTLLLIARFLQGATICAVIVAGNAAVHEHFNTKMAIKVFSFINTVNYLSPALGPLLGALIIETSNWRNIFYILTGCGVLGTLLNFLFCQETIPQKHPLRVERIVKDYYSLITSKQYMFPNLSYCLLISIIFIWMFEAPFMVMDNYGFSAIYYGVSQTMIFSCFFVGAILNRYVLNRSTLRVLVKLALTIIAVGVIAFALSAKFVNDMSICIVCLMIIATGSAMLFPPLNRLAMESSNVPMGSKAGIASILVSISGVLTGLLVTIIPVNNLFDVAILIVACVTLSVGFLFQIKIPEAID